MEPTTNEASVDMIFVFRFGLQSCLALTVLYRPIESTAHDAQFHSNLPVRINSNMVIQHLHMNYYNRISCIEPPSKDGPTRDKCQNLFAQAVSSPKFVFS